MGCKLNRKVNIESVEMDSKRVVYSVTVKGIRTSFWREAWYDSVRGSLDVVEVAPVAALRVCTESYPFRRARHIH